MDEADTIAAISTGPGAAGIAVVRISGPRAFAIADRVFRGRGLPPSRRPSFTFAHGAIHADGRDVDEALVLFMRAPHSYTREDTVEIQGHGGSAASRRVLRCVIEAGARPAEPGEFTRRAFLNGRIDLVQAEAVLDLIRAQSDRAAAAALEQLEGGLSRQVNEVYRKLVAAAAELEVSLDFPEDEPTDLRWPDVISSLLTCQVLISNLLSTWDEGHLLRDGISVVISGKPNVGKSTLLNVILGRDRAIVSDQPGTTRDTIEETFLLDGVPLRLVDTAGLRSSECRVEQEGIRRSREQIGKADVVLHVLDASRPPDGVDEEHLSALPARRTVLILNKVDLGRAFSGADFRGLPTVETDLLRAHGVQRLREVMTQVVESSDGFRTEPHAVISERHRALLSSALEQVEEAQSRLAQGLEENVVLAASQLRTAIETLGRIVGRSYGDDLLDDVFSRFCIGK